MDIDESNSDEEDLVFDKKSQLKKILGRGGSGIVYLLTDNCGKQFILKAVYKNRHVIKRSEYREIQINKLVKNHPNIANLVKVEENKKHYFLYFDSVGRGNVYNTMVAAGNRNEKLVARVVRDVLLGLQHCHKFNILHMDIKPENVIESMDGSKFFLCDFGWSRFVDSITKQTSSEVCGTLDYFAPDILDAKSISFPVDLWCVGILTFELLTGHPPFTDPEDREVTKQNIRELNFKFPWTLSSFAQSFIAGLLKFLPEDRNTIEACLNHKFIKDNI